MSAVRLAMVGTMLALAACADGSRSVDGGGMAAGTDRPSSLYQEPRPFRGPEQSLRGLLHRSFELSPFQACGSRELLWVQVWSPAPAGWDEVERTLACGTDASSPVCGNQTVFLDVVGVVSKPGGYGHRNVYSHEFEVRNVKSVSTTAPDDCILPPPRFPCTTPGCPAQ